MGKSQNRALRAGLVCLLAYLLGGAGILPGLLSAAAYLEGSHRVILSEGGGVFELRLCHETGELNVPSLQMEHRHGTIARLLCTFSNPSNQTPDHVVHLLTSFLSESTRQGEAKHSTGTVRPASTPAPPPCGYSGCGTVFAGRIFHEAHAPPVTPGLLVQLRTTVLLI